MQTSTNNVNNIWALLQTTGRKVEPNIALCENQNIKTHNRTTQKAQNNEQQEPQVYSGACELKTMNNKNPRWIQVLENSKQWTTKTPGEFRCLWTQNNEQQEPQVNSGACELKTMNNKNPRWIQVLEKFLLLIRHPRQMINNYRNNAVYLAIW